MGRETLDTRAFLLKSTPYGESDRILSLFTEARGKLSAIALGARRSRKRFGGSLEPFALLQARLALRPSTDLARLELAEVLEPNLGVSKQLVSMGQAGAALELCRELLAPDQPEPRLFRALESYLRALDVRGPSLSRMVGLELCALEVSGLHPRLGECGVCGKPVPPRRAARFDPARGGVVCRSDGGGPITLSGRALEGLRALAAGRDAELAEGDAKNAADALRALTEWHLGRQLKGAAFLRQISD
ncbi:MAG: DNA repair protein RecO [Deltaproteobacteria bacterium]|nr:DNA repair protein RecO [Deltaproteobacteria bacterium]